MTECNQSQFEFEVHFSRRVVAEFSGARLTSDGGALLLRAADRRIALLRCVVRCFHDARDPAAHRASRFTWLQSGTWEHSHGQSQRQESSAPDVRNTDLAPKKESSQRPCPACPSKSRAQRLPGTPRQGTFHYDRKRCSTEMFDQHDVTLLVIGLRIEKPTPVRRNG
jgi:hypothetical protein